MGKLVLDLLHFQLTFALDDLVAFEQFDFSEMPTRSRFGHHFREDYPELDIKRSIKEHTRSEFDLQSLIRQLRGDKTVESLRTTPKLLACLITKKWLPTNILNHLKTIMTCKHALKEEDIRELLISCIESFVQIEPTARPTTFCYLADQIPSLIYVPDRSLLATAGFLHQQLDVDGYKLDNLIPIITQYHQVTTTTTMHLGGQNAEQFARAQQKFQRQHNSPKPEKTAADNVALLEAEIMRKSEEIDRLRARLVHADKSDKSWGNRLLSTDGSVENIKVLDKLRYTESTAEKSVIKSFECDVLARSGNKIFVASLWNISRSIDLSSTSADELSKWTLLGEEEITIAKIKSLEKKNKGA